MQNLSMLHPKYVTNESGKKIAVMLPIKEFEELLEDLADLTAIAERQNEPVTAHAEVIKKLKKNDVL